MAILITVLVFFIASLIFDKKVFPAVYAKTAINPFNFLQKLLSFVFTLSLIGYIPGMNDSVPGILLGSILVEVVLVALFALLNLKFKDPKYIVLVTALQVVFSVAFAARALIWLIMLALNFGGLALGQSWSIGSNFKLFGDFKSTEHETIEGSHILDKINEDAKQRAEANKKSAEAEQKRRDEKADAIAASYGYSSAEEAEDHGISTGKYDT